MSERTHTLIIRPGALGDCVLTLPTLHALRLAGARSLVVLGTPASWGFVRKAHDGLRARDFAAPEWLGLFSEEVPLGPCAQATLAQTQRAIVYLPDADGVRRVLEKAGVAQVVCMAPPTAAAANGTHASRHLLHALQGVVSDELARGALAVLDESADVFLSVNEAERVLALGKLGLDAAPDGGLVALHPGSGGRKKCWPARHFARLAVELACRQDLLPLVFFGPADEAVRSEFEEAVPAGVHWECVNCWPLREVLALLTLCRGYVGNDSGVTHLAARACPALALFGPSAARVWSPLGQAVRILQAPEGLLDRLGVNEVAAAATEMLRNSPP